LLTLAGTILNGDESCACVDLLAPYVLDQDESNPCSYLYEAETECGTLRLELTMGSASIAGSILINATPHAQISFPLTAPYDCSAARTVSPLSNIGVSQCDFTNVTAALAVARPVPTTGGITKDNADDYYALFKALNFEGSYDCVLKRVTGGFAAIFKGPVYMDQIIGPDGSCLNPSTVSGTIDNFVNVRRVGDVRIVENDDGDYELQAHEYTDTVAAQIEDHGWLAKYTFPKTTVVENIDWDVDGNKTVRQTRLSNVSVVAAGSSSTSNLIATERIRHVVEDVTYSTTTHVLDQFLSHNVWVFSVGSATVQIVDQAEPCSGAPEEVLQLGSADLTVGAATLSASATFAVQVYTGAAALSAPAATLAAQATYDPQVYSAAAALTAAPATLSATATHVEP
jgi:hypothetical protein